jgi:hypothetical protein
MGSHKTYPEIKFEVTAKKEDEVAGMLGHTKLSHNRHIK